MDVYNEIFYVKSENLIKSSIFIVKQKQIIYIHIVL